MKAVIVNRRPVIDMIGALVQQSAAKVHLICPKGLGPFLPSQIAPFIEVTFLDDYDAPEVEQIVYNTCVALGADVLISTTEADVIRCARVRDRLGLPGQSLESAIAFRDKLQMKTLIGQAGVSVASMARGDDMLGLSLIHI